MEVVSEWRVKVERDPVYEEGTVFAWKGSIYRGGEYVTSAYGGTRDELLVKARATVERLQGDVPADEWVSL